jgi:hypothetical protein
MEWADETCSRCLLVSSKDSAHLKTVIAMLHNHGIQTEEGLHRPWRSASFESSVMVAPEDFLRASELQCFTRNQKLRQGLAQRSFQAWHHRG